ncbi:hypothetical protein Q7P37_011526 [Cladosporium fusiforme]
MVARANRASKNASRGPAATRRDRAKADRDGDLSMDGPVKGRGGRVGKSSGSNARKDLTAGGKPKGGILSSASQRAILKHAGAGDVSMKGSKSVPSRGLTEIRITNWTKSKASNHADGGVSSLITWLEKKASNRLSSRVRKVKINKSQKEGEDLIISVPAEDAGAMLRLDGWQWAGINVKVERIGGDANAAGGSKTEQTRDMIKGVLERRYNIESKFLDLSVLRQDEKLKEQSIFNVKSTAGKFFPAMMRVLEGAFETPKDKDDAVQSVSLSNNELADLTVMSTLPQTLPKLKNLDLSNNKFEKLDQLALWKKRFYHLEQLILTGNPIEQAEPDYAASVIQWFPNLRSLNGIQVRTEEDIANRSKVPDLPFPIRTPAFQDEGGIAEGFIRNFIAGFDTDRAALTSLYYDEQSEFSYSVNTGAPRDPSNTEQTEKQEWGDYIKNSRNLKKITQLPARQNRKFRGPQAVSDVFVAFPKTKHADLATEAKKYMIEAHIQPGVPDPSGGSQSGVDGFFVSIHGEFDELDNTTGQPKKKRSFDRTFILGPGGPSGVRVVSDILTVRAYGGAQAFDPDNFEGWNGPAAAAPAPDGAPQLPAGLTIEVAEQMCLELQKQTRMTIGYAKECLEQVNWDFATALQAFESVKANLPPDAFVAA